MECESVFVLLEHAPVCARSWCACLLCSDSAAPPDGGPRICIVRWLNIRRFLLHVSVASSYLITDFTRYTYSFISLDVISVCVTFICKLLYDLSIDVKCVLWVC